jgi:hypothetical protein
VRQPWLEEAVPAAGQMAARPGNGVAVSLPDHCVCVCVWQDLWTPTLSFCTPAGVQCASAMSLQSPLCDIQVAFYPASSLLPPASLQVNAPAHFPCLRTFARAVLCPHGLGSAVHTVGSPANLFWLLCGCGCVSDTWVKSVSADTCMHMDASHLACLCGGRGSLGVCHVACGSSRTNKGSAERQPSSRLGAFHIHGGVCGALQLLGAADLHRIFSWAFCRMSEQPPLYPHRCGSGSVGSDPKWRWPLSLLWGLQPQVHLLLSAPPSERAPSRVWTPPTP